MASRTWIQLWTKRGLQLPTRLGTTLTPSTVLKKAKGQRVELWTTETLILMCTRMFTSSTQSTERLKCAALLTTTSKSNAHTYVNSSQVRRRRRLHLRPPTPQAQAHAPQAVLLHTWLLASVTLSITTVDSVVAARMHLMLSRRIP